MNPASAKLSRKAAAANAEQLRAESVYLAQFRENLNQQVGITIP
jgi:hypothetical protein